VPLIEITDLEVEQSNRQDNSIRDSTAEIDGKR
jgi:hypothetical protein